MSAEHCMHSNGMDKSLNVLEVTVCSLISPLPGSALCEYIYVGFEVW